MNSQTGQHTRVHDEALALVKEAVEEYLPVARARRTEMDRDSWAELMNEVRSVAGVNA